MKKLTFVLLFLPFLIQAQDGVGVHFEDGMSWAAVQAKAKAEHKYIFMDCYTTWCGPCKYMKAKVFPQAESGTFFNDQFISVGVQLDSTSKDNDTVKAWYADAHAIMEKYHVRAYPTFLVFSPDGQALTRVVGGDETAAAFIERVKASMTPDKQYYTLLNEFGKGRHDTAFLLKMFTSAQEAYDKPTSAKAANEYLTQQKDPYTKHNLELIGQMTQSSQDKGFSILLKNPAKADAVLGEGKAEQMVKNIVLREEVFSAFPKTGSPDWAAIQKKVSARYPQLADEILLKSQIIFAQSRNDWVQFQPLVVSYMKKYSQKASANDLNDFAFAVFQHCPDMSCVSEALEWSKRSFQNEPNAAYYDTYANILYKLGKKDEAISWEQKGLDLAGTDEKPTYQDTLDKMRKGEKTWD